MILEIAPITADWIVAVTIDGSGMARSFLFFSQKNMRMPGWLMGSNSGVLEVKDPTGVGQLEKRNVTDIDDDNRRKSLEINRGRSLNILFGTSA